MPARPETPQQRQHAHDRARARGFAAAKDGTPNRYSHGSYCWIEFEEGKKAGLKAMGQELDKAKAS